MGSSRASPQPSVLTLMMVLVTVVRGSPEPFTHTRLFMLIEVERAAGKAHTPGIGAYRCFRAASIHPMDHGAIEPGRVDRVKDVSLSVIYRATFVREQGLRVA